MQIKSDMAQGLKTADKHRLRSDAAAAWDALSDEVTRRYGWRPALTDSWRSYETQERIFRDRYQTTPIQYAPGKTDRRTWQGRYWYRRPGTAAAAVPGTSNHGSGTAVDVASGVNTSWTSQRHREFAAVAPSFGFTDTEGRKVNEPWHWGYTRTYTPVTTPAHQEDDMTPEQARQLTAIYDTLTPGQAGVKHEGAIYGRVRVTHEAVLAIKTLVSELHAVFMPGKGGVRHEGAGYRILRTTGDAVSKLIGGAK